MALGSILNVSNPAKIGGISNFGKIYGSDAPGEFLGAFATLSSKDKGSSVTLSGGDLTYSTSTLYNGVLSTALYTTGKREFWVFNDMGNRMMAGVGTWQTNVGNYPAADVYAVAAYAADGRVYKGGGTAQYLGIIADQTWFGIRHDADTGEVWFKRAADGGWTLASVSMPLGAVYGALVGSGTSGAADPATVAFDPESFPETIGGGFEPLREPILTSYIPLKHDDRYDLASKIDPTWSKWGWAVSDTFGMFGRKRVSSGKYEYWVRRSSNVNTAKGMSGFGSSSHNPAQYPGENVYGTGFYYLDGTMWANASKSGNPTLGAVAINDYVGHRIDITGQTIEYTIDNGSNWYAQTNVNAAFWSDGLIAALVGASSATGLGYDPADFMEAIFNPSLFPVAISGGYSPFAS